MAWSKCEGNHSTPGWPDWWPPPQRTRATISRCCWTASSPRWAATRPRTTSPCSRCGRRRSTRPASRSGCPPRRVRCRSSGTRWDAGWPRLGQVRATSTKSPWPARNDAVGLIVDLSGVTYLDSRGLHLLFELAERLRVRDQLLHVVVPETALIGNMLKLTQFSSVVPVFATVQEAVDEML